MKEAAITQSPHAFVPKKTITEAEREELYRTRIDESFKPYTVIDVLQKVYHRSFADDLKQYIGEHPQKFRKNPEKKDWAVSNIWVHECRVIRMESIFEQPAYDYRVDIHVEARVRIEEVMSGRNERRWKYTIRPDVRLRYRLNLAPCELTCVFVSAVCEEKYTLAHAKTAIPVDKYLFPVLREKDYRDLADWIIEEYFPQNVGRDVPFNAALWVMMMHSPVYYGVFPEEDSQDTLGEYFFNFGSAMILDQKTGEPVRADIDPGSILINQNLKDESGKKNSTLAHEGVHKFLATPYFMLQRTHGHQYSSYMCKRRFSRDAAESHDRWTPVDIMEMQANKLPGYLLIHQEQGKKHAEMLLESYGGERSLENMKRLVEDMASYYMTTKTMARTRLIDFGFTEARGIMQSANGELVPSYLSDLKDNYTYTISEEEGVKEYLRNEKFRAAINSGLYLYVEGHYCLNDRKYIFTDPYGSRHLTPMARENMARCCLVFKRSYENAVTRIINGVIRKAGGRGKKEIQYVDQDGKSVLTAEGIALRKKIEQQMQEAGTVHLTFNQMTVELMKQKGISTPKLAEKTGISEETIKRMRNDPSRVFPIQAVVAVCVALHLSPETSRRYIDEGPSKFLPGTDMMLYQYALKEWYQLPVDVVNRKLVEAGAKPLTSLVEGYDENGVKLP